VSVLEYLEKHLPAKKATTIIDYVARHNCTLRITRPRKTKRGDFRQLGTKQSITINQDSNSFRFLFTLIHELAHLETFIQHKNQVKPHGVEWKF
jgi:Zn-dependent peptidase ImmA (M78 family)